MKGLLLKDLYTIIGNMRTFLLIMVVFAILPNTQIAPFAMIYAAMLPINTLAWDEQSKWNSFAEMMPYSKLQLVLSKYIFGYGFLIITFVLSVVASFLGTMLPFTNYEVSENLLTIYGSFTAGILLMNINLPLMFRIGVEKGRMLFRLLLAGFMVLYVVALEALDDINIEFMPTELMAGALIAVLIAISVLSMVLSVKWYGKNN